MVYWPYMPKEYKIEISPKTIIFTVLFLLSLHVLWIMRELIFSFIIAFIIMSALNLPVAYLEKKRIPRPVSALLLFVVIIAVLSYMASFILPPIIVETSALLRSLPEYLSKVNFYGVTVDVNDLSRYIPNITSNAFDIILGTFSNIVFVITTLFFSYYFLIEEKFIKKFLTRFVKHEDAAKVALVFEKAEVRMREWIWAEFILMFTIGLLTYIGLVLIGARYALPMAVLAGLLEVVPMVGPVISAIPAILVNGMYSIWSGTSVAALYFIVQQLENQIIVPIVMRRATGLNPIVTLAALIIGGKLGGILGMLLSVPMALFVETVITEIAAARKNEAK